MREYENLILFDPELGEEGVNKKLEEIKELIEKNGKLLKIDDRGVTELAYPVNKKTQGHYVLLEFTGEKEVLTELERSLKLSKEILRHCVVRKGK